MIEEAGHEPRRIVRQELMHDAGREPLLGELRRSDRAGGDQHVEILGGDALHQRKDGGKFAHAGPVHPHQRSSRPRDRAVAAPLMQPRVVFLAALEAMGQQQVRQRFGRPRHHAIGAQRKRQPLCHNRPLRAAVRQRNSPEQIEPRHAPCSLRDLRLANRD